MQPGLAHLIYIYSGPNCTSKPHNLGLENSSDISSPLDVILGEVGMDGGHVDPVVLLSFFRDLVNHRLRLRHIARPAYDLRSNNLSKIFQNKD